MKPPTPPEPPLEPLREVSTPEEALEVFHELGAGEDARRFLAGDPNRNPRWAVRDPRSASAMAVLQNARAAGVAARPPKPEPAAAPAACPDPAAVPTFAALMALPIQVKTAFYERHPGHVAVLKREEASRLAYPVAPNAA
jgi:hypothetical protein